MFNKWFVDVLAFHRHMKQAIALPRDKYSQMVWRRRKLIHEEYMETMDALDTLRRFRNTQHYVKAEQHVAQELVDLIYVCLGTFVEMGLNPEPVWEAVQAANMQKLPNPDGGKAIKPTTWTKPEIRLAVFPSSEEGIQAIVDSSQSLEDTLSRVARLVKQAERLTGEQCARIRREVASRFDQ